MYLGYDNADGVFTAANLNGQVTGTLWNTQGDDAQRKYDYTYDNAGRLSTAVFNERPTTGDAWSNARLDFGVSGVGGKIGYDLNGNLLSMTQMGIKIGAAAPIKVDDLQYSYAALTNKLMTVSDASPLGADNGKQGDFKDGANGAADDYVYDDNGNLVVDLNKGVKDLVGTAGIRYNFLDKPEEIRIAGKGTVKIVYDAEGNKLQKLFTPEGTGNTTTTTYINGYVYREVSPPSPGGEGPGVRLQYISFEEGRLRIVQPVAENNGFDFVNLSGNLNLADGKQGTLDYYIRDYQQNVRMILTEESHIGSNQATMEPDRAAGEEAVFGQPGSNNEVAVTRFAVSSIPGQGSGGGWTNPNIGWQVSRLGNLAARKVGPNALLKVMAGDEVSSMVDYYYLNPVTNGTGNNLLNDVVTQLLGAISGSPVASGGVKDGATNIGNNLNVLNSPFGNAVAPDANNPNGNLPKAYLNVLFFNERFEYVAENSGALRVQGAGNGQSPLTLLNLKAPKNGYCFVYLSNESNEHIYFDNFKVTHNRGRIIEENHYYAYGLKIQAISSAKAGDAREGHLNNLHLYNDKELIDDADLGWYDYGFRNYDPQIGRFPQLDPLTFDYPYYTPYQYAGCEPIANVDVDGLEPAGSVIGTAAQPVTLSNIIIKTSPAAAKAASAARGLALLGNTATFGSTLTKVRPGHVFANQAINNSFRWSLGAQVGARGGLLGIALLSPLQAGNAIPDHNPPGMHWGGDQFLVNRIPNEILTNDPSTLSDEYLQGVEQRLLQGGSAAAYSDYQYAKELILRKAKRGMKGIVKAIEDKLNDTRVENLTKEARKLYPKKTKTELHHITPKYLGGAKDGPVVPLDGAYHQMITNAFRLAWPYGKGPIADPVLRRQIMDQVYKQFPLPSGYTY